MELWIIFLILGVICAVMGTATVLHRKTTPVYIVPDTATSEDGEPNLTLPQEWDEKFLTSQFDQLRTRPPLLTHFYNSVVDRFVLNQDEKTSRARLRFLATKVEQLKTAKAFATSLDDLKLHEIERDIRRRKLELERQDLDNKLKRQQERATAEHQLEMAKLNKRIRTIESPPRRAPNPTQPPPKPTDEEIRAEKRARCEAELERLKKGKEDWLAKIAGGRSFDELPPDVKDEYKSDENMWDHRIQAEKDKLEEYL